MKQLQTQDLCDTVPPMHDLAERVRLRLRDEMTRKHLSQNDVADLIKWTQSRVAQKLTGRTPITVEELEVLAFAVGLLPTELVRDHGLEFCAEMTPTEVRLLERIRDLGPAAKDGLFQLLNVRTSTNRPERHAAPLQKKTRSGRT